MVIKHQSDESTLHNIVFIIVSTVFIINFHDQKELLLISSFKFSGILYYKVLRTVFNKKPKEELDEMTAPPDKIALFFPAKQLINIMNKKLPLALFNCLDK